ncbi:response regulator transcription factor [Streptococcus thermophilus]|uniref:response regulator transcription factor n=1 Tax=Streptococcus thermophilus TaxID=1308 RepID=UPI000230D8AA|nr:response regulator transcription factor [Streptococcus thermophilus]EHE92258.1 Two-component response regulator [Streptococcus thermophilus CNCM I-1630]CDA41190.1 two-component response regulator [Streptococcus thermophilus CAG:236]MCT1187335.1 DNA-binding response regulator [Streptococcus thermophilus]MCT2906683.1 DNA-binding response regulator [Streptococcus thermophilus]MCT2914384.1 DNA-binding response regulator [Streptococcus thermophilus]
MHKILLVEDDEVIRQQVKKMLEQWGYEVVLVEDFMEVLSIFVKVEPHLVLMDIGLPLFNGYHWCQEIRKVSKVPIMFLSSRDQAMDIVMAINMGGDDFVTKPFDQNVLLAKIQGLLRRSYEFGKDQSLLEYMGVILNLKAMDLVYQGEVVSLTKNEFQILQVLFERSGNIVSREDLMKELWNSDFFIDDNTLSVNVARLRKKLEVVGLKDFIETKKGVGYGLRHDG